MRKDVVVLGAGIVGVSIACTCRSAAVRCSSSTSAGRARDLVRQCGSDPARGRLPRTASRTISAPCSVMRSTIPPTRTTTWRAIPRIAPFLFQYWMHSRPARHEEIARMYAPLIEHSDHGAHDARPRRPKAAHLIRHKGWIKVFRSQQAMDEAVKDAEETRRKFGSRFRGSGSQGPGREGAAPARRAGGRPSLDRSGLGLRSSRAHAGLCAACSSG